MDDPVHPAPRGGPRAALRRGFSLLELVVTLVVIVTLATLLVPGLRSAWLRTRRAEAIAALARLQLDQERFHLERGRYAGDLPELQAAVGAGVAPERYVLRVASATADEFSAEALAAGAQTADRADCQRLAVNQRGERSPPAASGCWR
jgi:prepilin-type N-terminal cleavage/methylation domain-containing protein